MSVSDRIFQALQERFPVGSTVVELHGTFRLRSRVVGHVAGTSDREGQLALVDPDADIPDMIVYRSAKNLRTPEEALEDIERRLQCQLDLMEWLICLRDEENTYSS